MSKKNIKIGEGQMIFVKTFVSSVVLGACSYIGAKATREIVTNIKKADNLIKIESK